MQIFACRQRVYITKDPQFGVWTKAKIFRLFMGMRKFGRTLVCIKTANVTVSQTHN